jgi:hypothetical protein
VKFLLILNKDTPSCHNDCMLLLPFHRFCTLCCTLRKYNSLRDDFEARIDLEAGRVGREATDEGDSKERSVSDDWSNGSIQWTGKTIKAFFSLSVVPSLDWLILGMFVLDGFLVVDNTFFVSPCLCRGLWYDF